MTLLTVTDLQIGKGLVRGVSFRLHAGERLGIIGESGSGKSLTAYAIKGISSLPVRGTVEYRGTRMGFVFQEPLTALDPLMRAGRQVTEVTKDASATRRLFVEVGLEERHLRAYPHELSGGQRQRVLIAMALAGNPELVICDEPTTALDATVQEHIIELIVSLTEKRGMALLFITHDLALMSRVCHNVLVMRGGEIVERGPIGRLTHPYSRALLAATRLQPLPAPAPAPELAVEAAHVHRRFPQHLALRDVSLRVCQGERLGIVGGSGSGKTTLLNLLAGLDHPTEGTVRVRGRVQMVFQDPQGSLNPRRRVGRSITEPVDACHSAEELLERVGLSAADARRFPHEFSGGQRQRISLARALSCDPDIVLADEAVSALDVTVRRRIIELLDDATRGRTLIFVSHDLAVIRALCTRVVVLHDGRVVEEGPVADVWEHPREEYTRGLLAAARLEQLD